MSFVFHYRTRRDVFHIKFDFFFIIPVNYTQFDSKQNLHRSLSLSCINFMDEVVLGNKQQYCGFSNDFDRSVCVVIAYSTRRLEFNNLLILTASNIIYLTETNAISVSTSSTGRVLQNLYISCPGTQFTVTSLIQFSCNGYFYYYLKTAAAKPPR